MGMQPGRAYEHRAEGAKTPTNPLVSNEPDQNTAALPPCMRLMRPARGLVGVGDKLRLHRAAVMAAFTYRLLINESTTEVYEDTYQWTLPSETWG